MAGWSSRARGGGQQVVHSSSSRHINPPVVVRPLFFWRAHEDPANRPRVPYNSANQAPIAILSPITLLPVPPLSRLIVELMSDRVVKLKRGKRGPSFYPSPTTPLVHFVSSGSTPTGHQFLRRPRDVDWNKNASISALLRAGDLWVLFSPEGVMKILTPTLSPGKTPAVV